MQKKYLRCLQNEGALEQLIRIYTGDHKEYF